LREKLIAAFMKLLDSAISAAPKVVVGIAVLVIGLLLAKIIETVLRFVLTRIRFDTLMEKAGIDKMLQRVGVRQQLNFFLPRLVYFLTLLVLAKTASDALGLTSISEAIGAFFSYLPNIIAALLLLILGTSIGQFAGQTVAEAAKNSGIEFGPALGKLVSFLIVFVVAMMAIAQLQIDTTMVRTVTSFIMGGVALAFGLAFGLGTRDVVRNIAAGFYLRKNLEIGRPLEIAGQSGVLKGITATHAILENGDSEISVANTLFLEQVAKQ
jgi:Conserved TM helix/Mechanosensitive ion channel